MSITLRDGIAFATLAGAVFGPGFAQDPVDPPDWLQQAKLIASQEGVSVGEAVRRIRLQQKAQRANERFFADPDYAGAIIAEDARGLRVKFNFKGGKRVSIDDQELSSNSDFAPALRSLVDLRQARADLGLQLRNLGLTGVFSETLATQSMDFYPADPAGLKAAMDAGRITFPDYVRVQNRPLDVKFEYDVYGSGDIAYSGSTNNCTGGFNVANGSVRGLSTAGHCANAPLPSTHRGQPIGTLQSVSRLHDGNGLDVSWFRNSSFLYPNRVRINSTSYYSVTVALSAPPPVNYRTCVLPRASPEACTTVLQTVYWDTTATGQYTDGPYVLTVGYLTAPKDSGSPWLLGGEAHGIHLGSTSTADGIQRSVFSPVSSLPRMGLKVVTAP